MQSSEVGPKHFEMALWAREKAPFSAAFSKISSECFRDLVPEHAMWA
jgi:hypothetical protein